MNSINIKLTISYDGTNYCGFQSQSGGGTVQDELHKAIKKITGKHQALRCAGRTDTGVHAEGQVVNFHTAKLNMTEANWLAAMNTILPRDIRVLKCEFADRDFDARNSAVMREYWYRIVNAPVISALDVRYAVHYPQKLNVHLLQSYCDVLAGEHDFSAFSASSDTSKSKCRFIKSIRVEKKKDHLTVRFVGNAYLHHMIRNIIGTLIMLHKMKAEPSEMKKILASKNRKLAGPTFAPHGLVLKKVYY